MAFARPTDDPKVRKLLGLPPLPMSEEDSAEPDPFAGVRGILPGKETAPAEGASAPWQPADIPEDSPLMRDIGERSRKAFQTAPDPETVHVDQQLAAASKSPTITPAAGHRAAFTDVPGMIGEMGSGLLGALGSLQPFGGASPSIAHAANPGTGAAPSAHTMDDNERIRRAAEINARNRAGKGEEAAGSNMDEVLGHAPPAAPYARPSIARPGTGHTYGNEDLAIERAAGPSRGGFMQPDVKDVAYLPDSVLEEARTRSQLEDVTTPRGQISPSQEQAIAFESRRGEIKFAAMDKIIDEERDRRVAEARAAQASPERKAAAIKFAMEDAAEKKLKNRQIGMAGWPRRQSDEIDPFTGEPMMPSYGGAPGGR